MSNFNSKSKENSAAVFPEHGPLDENGREILLSVKNIDITFGKKENAVKAVQNVSFDIYKGESLSLVTKTLNREIQVEDSCDKR